MDQLDRLGWVDHRNYRIWTDRFQIRTTSARFAEWLDYALADYGLRRTAPTRYSIVIEDHGHDGRPGHRFHLLYRGARQIVRSLSVGTVARMLMGELEATLFPRRSDAIYLQTALLRSGAHAALLPAPFLTWIGGLGRGVGRRRPVLSNRLRRAARDARRGRGLDGRVKRAGSRVGKPPTRSTYPFYAPRGILGGEAPPTVVGARGSQNGNQGNPSSEDLMFN